MAMGGTVLGLTTADGRRPRVAIVGGTPATMLVAGVLIEHFGCLLVTAANGAAIAVRDDPIDLIVADLPVADRDGVRRLRAIATAPIIALTDDGSDAGARRARAAGCAAALAKPYSPRQLYAAMHVALFGPATIVAAMA